jgi:hypothetical protein
LRPLVADQLRTSATVFSKISVFLALSPAL